MPRAKGGVVLRRRHNKILKLTKGQRMSRRLLWRRANEGMLKSLFYATRDRRNRKRDMRGLWIARINAAARLNGITYSRLTHALRVAVVSSDRKVLADWPSVTRRHYLVVEVAKAMCRTHRVQPDSETGMLTSPDNPKVKLARALLERKGGEQQGRCLDEGVRLIEAVRAGLTPALLLYGQATTTPVRISSLPALSRPTPVMELLRRSSPRSPTPSPAGRHSCPAPAAAPPPAAPRLALVLDQVRAPATWARSCAALKRQA